jgi:phage tail-like protein
MAVGDVLRADIFTVELGKFQVATYQEASGLAFGQDATEAKTVTPKGQLLARKLPGARQLPDITLSRPMDANHAWTDWVVQSATSQDVDEARANIGITLLDTKRNPILRVNLHNAWAKSWEGPALQAGNSEAAIEKITLAYDDITIDN